MPKFKHIASAMTVTGLLATTALVATARAASAGTDGQQLCLTSVDLGGWDGEVVINGYNQNQDPASYTTVLPSDGSYVCTTGFWWVGLLTVSEVVDPSTVVNQWPCGVPQVQTPADVGPAQSADEFDCFNSVGNGVVPY